MKLVKAFKSAAAAFFGVQSAKTYEQDFSSTTALPFIIAGIVLAIGLVFLVIVIVNIILA